MLEAPWVTVGVDLFDVFLTQIADLPNGLDIDVFCNVLSVKDAGRLRAGLDSGRFSSLRLVVDRGAFVRRNEAEDGQNTNASDIEGLLGAQRIRGICTHLKAIVWSSKAGSGCLISSANLNHNNRPECHERCDRLALVLPIVADRLFATVPPGIDGSTSAAYAAIEHVLNTVAEVAGGEGVIKAIAPPPDLGLVDDEVLITNKTGAGDLLATLMKRAGIVARVWISTWSLKPEHFPILGDLRREGVDVGCWLPSRFARRGQNQTLLSYVAALGESVRWSPTHAKIVLVEGSLGSFMLTGCANLGALVAVDLIRVRSGGAELADFAAKLLAGLPLESAPPLPEPIGIPAGKKGATVAAEPVGPRQYLTLSARLALPEGEGGVTERQLVAIAARDLSERDRLFQRDQRERMIRRWVAFAMPDTDVERLGCAAFAVDLPTIRRMIRKVRADFRDEAREAERIPIHEKRHADRIRLEELFMEARAKGHLSVAARCAEMLIRLNGTLPTPEEIPVTYVPEEHLGARGMTDEELAAALMEGQTVTVVVPRAGRALGHEAEEDEGADDYAELLEE